MYTNLHFGYHIVATVQGRPVLSTAQGVFAAPNFSAACQRASHLLRRCLPLGGGKRRRHAPASLTRSYPSPSGRSSSEMSSRQPREAKKTDCFVKLVEMGFAPDQTILAIDEVFRLHPHDLAVYNGFFSVRRDSVLVNKALDVLLMWGCVPAEAITVKLLVLEVEKSQAQKAGKKGQAHAAAAIAPICHIAVRPTYTAEFLRDRLAEREGVTVQQVRIYLGNVALANLMLTLDSYGITEGRTLRVVIGANTPPAQEAKLPSSLLTKRQQEDLRMPTPCVK
jgi:hypothetical protein